MTASIIRYPKSGPQDIAQRIAALHNISDEIGDAYAGQARAWDMQKAMEYLEEVGSDEAVEFMAKAILSWNESDSDIPAAIQKFMLEQSVRSIEQDLPVTNQQDKSEFGRPAANEDTSGDEDAMTDTKLLGLEAENIESSGLVAAMKFAHMLDAIENSLK